MRSPRRILGIAAALVLLFAAPAAAAPTWSAPAAGPGTAASNNHVAFDGSGNATAVWSQSSAGDSSVWAATRGAGAPGFGAAQRLSAVPAAGAASDADQPALAVDADGNAIVAWRVHAPGLADLITFSTRAAGSTNWSTPALASLDGYDASRPSVAFASAGQAFLVFNQTTATGRLSAKVVSVDTDTTAVTGVQTISATSSTVTQPEIAFDQAGNGTIIWLDSSVSFAPPYTATSAVRTATRKAGGSTFTLTQTLFSATDATVDELHLAFDRSGNTTVVWNTVDSSTGGPLAVYAVTRLTGAYFGAYATLSTARASQPAVAASDLGGAVVAWVETASGAADAARAGTVRAARRAPGATTYSAASTLSAPGELGQGPNVSAGGDGTILALWAKHSGTADSARAAVLAPGDSSFLATQSLGSAGGEVDVMTGAVDPAGNALAVWELRPSGGGGTPAQRVSRLDGSTVPKTAPTTPAPTTPAPTTPAPTTPAPTTPAPTTPAPTTPAPTTPTPTTPTPTTPTPTTPAPTTPAPTTPKPTDTSTTNAPDVPEVVVAPATVTPATIKIDKLLTSTTATGASLVSTGLAPLAGAPSMRSFKGPRSGKFRVVGTCSSSVVASGGLRLVFKTNQPGTVRVVVTRTTKGQKARNLKPGFAFNATQGRNVAYFSGCVDGVPLARGSYRLKAVFTNSAGVRGTRRALNVVAIG